MFLSLYHSYMAWKKKKSAAMGSGVPPPATATEPSLQGAMQNLITLNFLLLKETKDLREETSLLRFELAAISADRSIADGIQRDVCGANLSSHLSSAAEECAALLRKAGDELAAAKEAAEEKRKMLCSAEKKLLAEMDLNMDLKLVVEEKRMKLEYLEEKLLCVEDELTQNSAALFESESECRRLQEQDKIGEEMMKTAVIRTDSLQRLVEEKELLILKLSREIEERKITEIRNKGLQDKNKQATTQLVSLYEDLRTRKGAEIKPLKTEVESNSSKIIYLEKKWCCKDQITSLPRKRSKFIDSYWFYPATIGITVAVSFALAARAR